jgi:serine/threonine-protein kinase
VNIPGFQVLRPVGTGRTAFVYLAKDKLGRDVALKIPKPEVFKDPSLAKMFANEVMLSRSLEHPNIVTTFEGQPNGPTTHLSMKYFPNGSIEDVDFMSVTAMRILRDIAAALEYCHGRRITHQDIKPGNIYMHEGVAYLADFGAAANETQDGQVAGSPFYMAPELFMGERGSTKSDIYSFGIVAYEVLTGVRPIVGETLEQLQAAHLAKVPAPVRTIKSSVAREVATMVDRAIAKNPMQRPTASEFRRALESALDPKADAEARKTSSPETTRQTPSGQAQSGEPSASEKPTPVIGRPAGAAARRIEPRAARVKEETPKGFLGRLFPKKK